jgi:hypothetical protein
MPKVGGAISTASTPARQKARTSRSMASSLPRPTAVATGRTPYKAASAARAARPAAARDSDEPLRRRHQPHCATAISFALSQIEPELVVLARRAVARRSRASHRAPGRAGSCGLPCKPGQARRHRALMGAPVVRRGPAPSAQGTDRAQAGCRHFLHGDLLDEARHRDAAVRACMRHRSAARDWCRCSSRPAPRAHTAQGRPSRRLGPGPATRGSRRAGSGARARSDWRYRGHRPAMSRTRIRRACSAGPAPRSARAEVAHSAHSTSLPPHQEAHRGRHQDDLRIRPVLGLRQQIGGDEGGIGRGIGDHQHFRWPGRHVDGDAFLRDLQLSLR